MSVSKSPCLSPLCENTVFNVLHRSPKGASVQASSVNATQRPYPAQQVCVLPCRRLCTHCCDLLILPRDVSVHIFALSYLCVCNLYQLWRLLWTIVRVHRANGVYFSLHLRGGLHYQYLQERGGGFEARCMYRCACGDASMDSVFPILLVLIFWTIFVQVGCDRSALRTLMEPRQDRRFKFVIL